MHVISSDVISFRESSGVRGKDAESNYFDY